MEQLHVGEVTRIVLPHHRREVPTFENLFGTAAAEVVGSMDRAGDDVPEQTPAHRINIDAVGVRRSDVIVTIEDPFGSGCSVNAVCTVSVEARVPLNRRGVHMSRIGGIVAESVTTTHHDLTSYVDAVARSVAESQYAAARVQVRARIPYLEEIQGDRCRQRKLSLEHLDVIAARAIRDGTASRDFGLRVTHLVACPCVQKTYRHAVRLGRQRLVESSGDPLITHSQRCVTRVVACGVTDIPPVGIMLARLDEVLFRTCNTLPRDAELSSVYRAHCAPQFIEDALRAAVMAVADLWTSPGSYRCISGRSRSLESIHENDLTASLSFRPLAAEGCCQDAARTW